MNLAKLFESQKIFRGRIKYDKPDRFNKLILALLVELGECANEWRGFKFWSVNQLPHTSAVRVPCMMDEDKEFYNPMLEEHIDGLHFILELGIEKGFEYETHKSKIKHKTVTEQYNKLFQKVGDFSQYPTPGNYFWIMDLFVGLGEMLGFTWEEIEQAYFEKNKINHQRQDNGY